MTRILTFIFFVFAFWGEAAAQDTLITYRGKVRNLKATVVYIDDRDIYVQTKRQRERMQRDNVSVVWEKDGNWKSYGKRIDHSAVAYIKKADDSKIVIHAYDKLLLTNGKIKSLPGKVVYYDYSDIFFQSDHARTRLVRDSLKRIEKQDKFPASKKEQRVQAKKAKKTNRKKAKQAAKVEALKTRYNQFLPDKEASLTPADFERWKQKQEAEIKNLKLKYQLYWVLRERSEEYEAEYDEAYFRSKYTRSRSRSKVFSILRADGTEEIVYNADTLGLLADGEYEVEYGVEDMRQYIKGRQDGRKHSFHDVYIGAGVGLASGLLFTYTLDMFYAPIPPAVCIAVIAGLNNFKPNPKLELTKAMLDSDPYMDGYIKSAKGRKIFAFTMGAIGGLGVGIGTAVATSPLLQ